MTVTCKLCGHPVLRNQGYFYGAHALCAKRVVDRAGKIAERRRTSS